jgi:hypothetical protein
MDRLADTRDLAILFLAFSPAPAQRSGAAARRAAEGRAADATPSARWESPPLPCLAIQVGRTKAPPTRRAGCFWSALGSRRCANGWSGRTSRRGRIFRAIYRWEGVDEKARTPQSINLIVQPRCAMAGVEPEAFSAQGLRRLSDRGGAARRGIALLEAMRQSQHRSVQQAASYYTEAERAQGTAARFYDAANGMTVRAVLSADNIVPA